MSLIGYKIGMTSLYKNNKRYAVTKIKIIKCFFIKYIYYKKYKNVLIGYNIKKKEKINKPLLGILNNINIYCSSLKEFNFDKKINYKIGGRIKIDIFKKNKYVTIIGYSKGKGFQGVIKRHNFSGVGTKTHGQHNRLRTSGSIGAGSSPSRVFKGKKMAGRLGNKQVTIKNNKILKLDIKNNILYIKGSIPGTKKKYIFIKKSCI